MSGSGSQFATYDGWKLLIPHMQNTFEDGQLLTEKFPFWMYYICWLVCNKCLTFFRYDSFLINFFNFSVNFYIALLLFNLITSNLTFSFSFIFMFLCLPFDPPFLFIALTSFNMFISPYFIIIFSSLTLSF